MDKPRQKRPPTIASWPDEPDKAESSDLPRLRARRADDEDLPLLRAARPVPPPYETADQASKTPAKKKRRRRWPWVTLALIVAFVLLVTWVPVLILRWVNPPTTAFMLETAAALPASKVLQQVWVPYDDISPAMRLAAVAGEDQTFPHNHGFDVKAIKAAMRENEQGDTLRGASTITQQLAKNLFLWPGQNYFRKGVEAWFTILIDVTWPKRRVLAMYLNVVQLGPQTFGVEAAAEHYFGKHAAQLSASEAALLAATLPDPQAYDPAHPSAYLLQRQSWILEQMRHLGSGYLNGL